MPARILLQVATVILLGVMNSYFLAMTDAWLWMALFGVLFPIIGLVDWALVRRRELPNIADRLLGYLLAGQVAVFALAGQPYWSSPAG
jgi:hypothetical protein